MERDRRSFLAIAGGAALAAAGIATPAQADQGKNPGDTLYGHGMVWNRDLPGILGALRLSFDMRVNLETGTGFGTAEDPVHPEWNAHFEIASIATEDRPKGETRYTMLGTVTEATNPENVGLPIKIVAETAGSGTAIAIRIGDNVFAGAGLVVIAIIAILIGLISHQAT